MKPGLFSVATLLGVTFYAAEALACPMCALNDKSGLGSWSIMIGLLLSPFAVTGGVLYALKRLAPDDIATKADKVTADGRGF